MFLEILHHTSLYYNKDMIRIYILPWDLIPRLPHITIQLRSTQLASRRLSLLNQTLAGDISQAIKSHRRRGNHRVVTSIKISDNAALSLRRRTSISTTSGSGVPKFGANKARARARETISRMFAGIGRSKVERYRQAERDEKSRAN